MTKAKSAPPSDAVLADIAAPLVVEAPDVAEEAPPSYVKIGVTPPSVCGKVRVIDVETGKRIEKVIEADAETGKLLRFAVEGGALVRDGDHFQTIEEERPIRIEWATGNQKDSF
ncbi:hypothetical protein KRZ98_10010 [Sphingobium sp. AS12]|uniref:hypothetical protein n=1 Tax=Sphingobium sp. AS12 TaxID=2849495 RepID=UPI001C312E51|nr:hypothetical protein [Sphingobium sp. AS12]MBV2148619.1 hypothetical protein [Sphingobium sp. AS12]